MKYKYKNLKHVILHGMKPGEIKEFDHPIAGGGIELIEESKSKEEKIGTLEEKSAFLKEKRYTKKEQQGVD